MSTFFGNSSHTTNQQLGEDLEKLKEHQKTVEDREKGRERAREDEAAKEKTDQFFLTGFKLGMKSGNEHKKCRSDLKDKKKKENQTKKEREEAKETQAAIEEETKVEDEHAKEAA